MIYHTLYINLHMAINPHPTHVKGELDHRGFGPVDPRKQKKGQRGEERETAIKTAGGNVIYSVC